MLYRARLIGDAPIIHNAGSAIDTTTPIARAVAEIAAKRGSNRTEADNLRLKELECQRSLWLDEKERPTVPHTAVRAVIEAAARKLKQGPMVREGLQVQSTAFEFDKKKYGSSLEQWGKRAQFTTPVVVQRARILRTRAMFETPWAVVAEIYGDEELVDKGKLFTWLDIGGQRIGLGDWRPERSGIYGRFHVDSVEEIKAK